MDDITESYLELLARPSKPSVVPILLQYMIEDINEVNCMDELDEGKQWIEVCKLAGIPYDWMNSLD